MGNALLEPEKFKIWAVIVELHCFPESLIQMDVSKLHKHCLFSLLFLTSSYEECNLLVITKEVPGA